MRLADDGVIAVAKYAALAGSLFEAVDADEAFDEDVDELDEESEFLHGNNQRVVFVAEMLLHELRRLPFHELALGAIGTALGFGAFSGDFAELRAAIGS